MSPLTGNGEPSRQPDLLLSVLFLLTAFEPPATQWEPSCATPHFLEAVANVCEVCATRQVFEVHHVRRAATEVYLTDRKIVEVSVPHLSATS